MRHVSLVAAFLLFAYAAPAIAQPAVEGPNGFVAEWNARMEPGNESVRHGLIAREWGRAHRYVLDRNQRRYFAYDLVLEASGDGNRLRVRVEPWSLTAADLAASRFPEASWTVVPLLKYPVVPEVRAGDTLVIDLLQNPTTGQRVVDSITFKRPGATAVAPSPLRDFSLSDVDLALENARVSVNGSLVEASARVGGEITGRVLWFYLPNRGRFVLSVGQDRPRGFDRLGEVAGRSLTFTVGRDRFAVQSTSSIVPGEGRFNLYVRHDPDWRPTGSEASAPFVLGAED